MYTGATLRVGGASAIYRARSIAARRLCCRVKQRVCCRPIGASASPGFVEGTVASAWRSPETRPCEQRCSMRSGVRASHATEDLRALRGRAPSLSPISTTSCRRRSSGRPAASPRDRPDPGKGAPTGKPWVRESRRSAVDMLAIVSSSNARSGWYREKAWAGEPAQAREKERHVLCDALDKLLVITS